MITFGSDVETPSILKYLNKKSLKDVIDILNFFIKMERSTEKELKCLLQIETLAEKCRNNKLQQT